MAPMAGPSREQVLSNLRSTSPTEFTLGINTPQAAIKQDPDGSWTLYLLEIDVEARDAAYEEAKATEPFFWMPESEWAFLQPSTVIVSAATASGLADAIETSVEWIW